MYIGLKDHPVFHNHRNALPSALTPQRRRSSATLFLQAIHSCWNWRGNYRIYPCIWPTLDLCTVPNPNGSILWKALDPASSGEYHHSTTCDLYAIWNMVGIKKKNPLFLHIELGTQR